MRIRYRRLFVGVSLFSVLYVIAIYSSDSFPSDIVTGLVSIRSNFSSKIRDVHPLGTSKTTISRPVVHTQKLLFQNAIYGYPFKYKDPYLLSNNDLCETGGNISIIYLIHSAPNHFNHRNVIRSTWANNSNYKSLGVTRHVFMLGKVQNSTLMKQIHDEFRRFGDILQGDFVDNYHNLSLNTLTGLRWVMEHCQNANFVVKLDDDVLVDPFRLLPKFVPSHLSRNKLVYCNTFANVNIRRNKKDKWFVDPSIFPGKRFFPTYCEGKLVLLSRDLVPLIYSTAASVQMFWIEDVYMYGMVLRKIENLDIKRYRWGQEFQFFTKFADKCIQSKNCMFISANDESMMSLWPKIQHHRPK